MNWNLTRREYMADFFIVPAYILAALASIAFWSKPSTAWVLHAALGAAAWTLAEYFIHRFVFHVVYSRDHARHHVRPHEWIGVTPLVSVLSLGILWTVLVVLMNDAGTAGATFIGFACGYFTYLSIHYAIHHSRSDVLDRLRRHHLLHHRGARSNFGVTSLFWDRIFRTLKAAH